MHNGANYIASCSIYYGYKLEREKKESYVSCVEPKGKSLFFPAMLHFSLTMCVIAFSHVTMHIHNSNLHRILV